MAPRGPQGLEAQLEAAQREGLVAACLAAEREAGLPRGVLLAVGLRESGLRNVVGDGGHGRGVFQIDDRYHREWLSSHGAGEPGSVPPVSDAARYAAGLLAANLAFGRANGVVERELLKFALSAYNAGVGGALAGYRRGDSDLETTRRDYGGDVLRRLEPVQHWLERAATPLLRPGARGRAVLGLKRRLRRWYGSRGRRAPLLLRGPVYGRRAVAAVKEFQRANGLEADGIVGPLTWAALPM